MKIWFSASVLAAVGCLAAAPVGGQRAGSRVDIGPANVMRIDGRPVFPIGFTFAPAPGALSPRGVEGLRELRQAGALTMRSGPMGAGTWTEDYIQREREWMEAAARNGMYVMPWLKELSAVPDKSSPRAEKLRRIVRLFRDHPGLGVWKGEDEPEWGKKPVRPLRNAYEIVRETDPNHPVWIVQAPRGTVDSLLLYNNTYDIGGIDIYPVSYPPGVHSNEKNKEISMVGDFAQRIATVTAGRKPFWMTLQIAFSGTVKPDKTLRFPTQHEQRFMAYQSIINGARGLVYFGGQLPMTLNERDARLGWNWTYWDHVLRPVIEEVGDHSPLAPALTAPDSRLPLRTTAPGLELLVRESGPHIYLLACKREGATLNARFTGLPAGLTGGEVMFESPRKVQVKDGSFIDWFGPFDVHVYRFKRGE